MLLFSGRKSGVARAARTILHPPLGGGVGGCATVRAPSTTRVVGVGRRGFLPISAHHLGFGFRKGPPPHLPPLGLRWLSLDGASPTAGSPTKQGDAAPPSVSSERVRQHVQDVIRETGKGIGGAATIGCGLGMALGFSSPPILVALPCAIANIGVVWTFANIFIRVLDLLRHFYK